jgi:hypothetical protein
MSVFTTPTRVYAHSAQLVWKTGTTNTIHFLGTIGLFLFVTHPRCVVVELCLTWITVLTKNILYPSVLREARGSPKAGRNGQGEQSQAVNSSPNLQ